MLATRLNRFHWNYNNVGNTASPGTTVTPGASDAEGSWTEIASAASVTEDVYEIVLRITTFSASSSQRPLLIDIGVDPAGGSSYTAIISNIPCGQANSMGFLYRFPFFIPAGASVAVRGMTTNGTANTFLAGVFLFGRPDRPEMIRAASVSETIGTITGTQGPSLTKGSGSGEGTWESLGTTSGDLWWWQIGIQVSDSVLSGPDNARFDLAFGDGSNKHLIIERAYGGSIQTLEDFEADAQFNCYCEVPAGSTIYVRATTNNSANVTALAIGLGG